MLLKILLFQWHSFSRAEVERLLELTHFFLVFLMIWSVVNYFA